MKRERCRRRELKGEKKQSNKYAKDDNQEGRDNYSS